MIRPKLRQFMNYGIMFILFVLHFVSIIPVRAQEEAVTVRMVGAQVTIVGTAGDDSIGVTSDQTDVVIKSNGIVLKKYPIASVKLIRALLSSGNDSFIAASLPFPCIVYGQTGNDTLVGGNSDDFFFGGDGRDVLVGNAGADSLAGNLGEDFIVGGSLNQDAIRSIRQNWFISANRFVTRVAAVSAASIIQLDDLDVDKIDGGDEQDSDVFLGSFNTPGARDIKLNFKQFFDASALVAPERMNIVLITADDLGRQLGCYGDTIATTPKLDLFASIGCRFKNGYVCQASCSPSRAAMLTGLYPHQNGQVGNVLPALATTGRPPYQLKSGIATLPTILRRNGYYTGNIGKFHVEPTSAFEFNYKALGSSSSRDAQILLEHLTAFNTNRGTSPFFLMLNIFDPHRPMLRDINGSPRIKVVSEQVVDGFPFNTQRSPERIAAVSDYYTCVNRLDELMGLVHDFFRQNGLMNNTVFVFVGDNGPAFDRAKATCYEAGLSTPFTLRWPGVTVPNQVVDKLVSTIDLMPTFLDVAHLPIPSDLPGRSLKKLLSTGSDSGWRKSYCAEYTAHSIEAYGPQRTIRKGQYKLILNLLADPAVFPNGMLGDQLLSAHLKRAVGPFVQLFDLNVDPYETTIVSDNPELATVKAELLEELLAWRIRTDDPLLDTEFLKSYTQWHIDNQPAQLSSVSE